MFTLGELFAIIILLPIIAFIQKAKFPHIPWWVWVAPPIVVIIVSSLLF